MWSDPLKPGPGVYVNRAMFLKKQGLESELTKAPIKILINVV
jgi:hypothetical protein